MVITSLALSFTGKRLGLLEYTSISNDKMRGDVAQDVVSSNDIGLISLGSI